MASREPICKPLPAGVVARLPYHDAVVTVEIVDRFGFERLGTEAFRGQRVCQLARELASLGARPIVIHSVDHEDSRVASGSETIGVHHARG